MRKRYSMYLDSDVVDAVDGVRGLIGRGKFINATLEQKANQIRDSGDVVGQI